MSNERLERLLPIIMDEWDNVVFLGTRVDGYGGTETFKFLNGNVFANQQVLEDALDDIMFGGGVELEGGYDGETEEEG